MVNCDGGRDKAPEKIKTQHDDVTTGFCWRFEPKTTPWQVSSAPQRPTSVEYRDQQGLPSSLTRQDVPEVAIGSGVNLRIGEDFFSFFFREKTTPWQGTVGASKTDSGGPDLFLFFLFFSSI